VQHVHPHRCLEVFEASLDRPPQAIGLGQLRFGILLGIEQRGHQQHRANAKSGPCEPVLQLADAERRGQGDPGFRRHPGGRLHRPKPQGDLVIRA